MCLILLAWRVHPDFPLVVAANRDEFFARATAPLASWSDIPQVLAGRDLEAGGTWMGVTRNGRFAALTNFRAPGHRDPNRPSRGHLVSDFLRGSYSAAEGHRRSIDYGTKCNGYNLLMSDGETLCWSSNVTGTSRRLEPGIYGLSNALLDSSWPKVGAGRTALEAAIRALPDTVRLSSLLTDDTVYPDDNLPQTGVPIEWERMLSAAFIRSLDYGTRSSTVVCADKDGWLSIDEQTWLRGAVRSERRRFRFRRMDR
jgi:uncharacterized protein with NRDE domain